MLAHILSKLIIRRGGKQTMPNSREQHGRSARLQRKAANPPSRLRDTGYRCGIITQISLVHAARLGTHLGAVSSSSSATSPLDRLSRRRCGNGPGIHGSHVARDPENGAVEELCSKMQ